jgi:hypothetical protein
MHRTPASMIPTTISELEWRGACRLAIHAIRQAHMARGMSISNMPSGKHTHSLFTGLQHYKTNIREAATAVPAGQENDTNQ